MVGANGVSKRVLNDDAALHNVCISTIAAQVPVAANTTVREGAADTAPAGGTCSTCSTMSPGACLGPGTAVGVVGSQASGRWEGCPAWQRRSQRSCSEWHVDSDGLAKVPTN